MQLLALIVILAVGHILERIVVFGHVLLYMLMYVQASEEIINSRCSLLVAMVLVMRKILWTWDKVPHLGGVLIGNDVEIGANTTIDRGALGNTIISEGVKLDNQIQIAHNVEIGAHTAIAGGVGIAGSAVIGKYCMIGGGVGINGHIVITDRVLITRMTQVTKSINTPGIYSSGTGMMKNADCIRAWCVLDI